MLEKLGLGGGCHWCTEGVFSILRGVDEVKQGWISSDSPYNSFSEAVLVHFIPDKIDLKTLIAIHLETRASTSQHSFRDKYRSAIYVFNQKQKEQVEHIVATLQEDFDSNIITKVVFFHKFKKNEEKYLDYYHSNPEAPFCKSYITPKIKKIIEKFQKNIDYKKIK